MSLRKIISGGQTGADQAALCVAKKFGLKTGGILPRGYKTLEGPRKDFAETYGCTEHRSESYVPRTYENARDSDGTIRLAANFHSPGEVCTLKAIEQYKKPHFDVDLCDPCSPEEVVDWIEEHNIKVLNVAGNSEKSYPGCHDAATVFLSDVLTSLGFGECDVKCDVQSDAVVESPASSGDVPK